MDDLEGTAGALRTATELLSTRARVHYNYGLVSQQLGRPAEAEAALGRAAALEPENPDFAYALATFYLAESRFDAALDWAGRLAALVPDAPGPQELLEEIERRRAAVR
jgi:tetratricopeptide (TPR) repeat protein